MSRALLAAGVLLLGALGTSAAAAWGPPLSPPVAASPLVWTDGPDASPYARVEDGLPRVRAIAGAELRAGHVATLANAGPAPVAYAAAREFDPGVVVYELRITRASGEGVTLDLLRGAGTVVLAPGEAVAVGVLVRGG